MWRARPSSWRRRPRPPRAPEIARRTSGYYLIGEGREQLERAVAGPPARSPKRRARAAAVCPCSLYVGGIALITLS